MKSRVADFQREQAPQVEAKDEAWFFSQLQRKNPEVYTKGKEFFLLCPFHADTSVGSFSVNRWTGAFKCFSCGAEGGWNKLADKLGVDKLKFAGGSRRRKKARSEESRDEEDGPVRCLHIETASDELVRAISKMGIKPHNIDKKGELNRPIASAWPREREWRGLDGRLLDDLGCVRVIDLRHNVERIGLPVRTPEGDLLGYTCRAIDPEDAKPKYAPLSADRVTWREKELPARQALFLVEKVLEEGWDRVVLVEGPYDALKLWAGGIPALAILGTNNWTPEKVAIISGLGLRAAVVLMDNDDSGQKAQEAVLDDLSPIMKAKGITLPEGVKDPGRMTSRQIAWLKSRLESI